MKIFGWPADFYGCAAYRIHEPLNELARRGHEVTATRVALGAFDDAMFGADVVVGQRVCAPNPSARWAAFRLFQDRRYRAWLSASWRSNRDIVHIVRKLEGRPGGRPKLVFEIDDDLWRVDPSSPHVYAWFRSPEVRLMLERNARLADVVTVSTPTLGEVMSQFNQNVHVIPNAVPAALLELPSVGAHLGAHVGVVGEVEQIAEPVPRATHQPSGLAVLDEVSVGPHVRGDDGDANGRVLQGFHKTFAGIKGMFLRRGESDVEVQLAPVVVHRIRPARHPDPMPRDPRPQRIHAAHHVQLGPARLLQVPHQLVIDLRPVHGVRLATRPPHGDEAVVPPRRLELAAEYTTERTGHLWEEALRP